MKLTQKLTHSPKKSPPNIVLVGAGRVATQLGWRLRARGLCPVQVLNRDAARGTALATALGGLPYSAAFEDVNAQADWLILAVRDDAVAAVAAQLAPHTPNALVTHTSGTTASTVLATHFARYGVFYPLQTFSLTQSPQWSRVPLCVYANGAADVAFLQKMARKVGRKVYEVDDAQRAQLHLAAVFANNFANHCFHIAAELLENAQLPFALLAPLIAETARKLETMPPHLAQTGPAIRGDAATIARHVATLSNAPEWQALYAQMSADIARLAPKKNG